MLDAIKYKGLHWWVSLNLVTLHELIFLPFLLPFFSSFVCVYLHHQFGKLDVSCKGTFLHFCLCSLSRKILIPPETTKLSLKFLKMILLRAFNGIEMINYCFIYFLLIRNISVAFWVTRLSNCLAVSSYFSRSQCHITCVISLKHHKFSTQALHTTGVTFSFFELFFRRNPSFFVSFDGKCSLVVWRNFMVIISF